MASPDAPKIAIIGAGIGGLAAAGFLYKAGISAEVYEQAPQLTEVGAGLIVTPNCARLVRALGQFDLLRERGVAMRQGWQFRRWENGEILFTQDLESHSQTLFGEEMFSAHRADLLDAVKNAVPPSIIHLDHQLVDIRETTSGVKLTFANGTTETFDQVIGADGVRSAVRRSLFGEFPAVYSGIQAFRAILPIGSVPEFARLREHNLWVGPEHHLVHYPIQSGTSVNLVAFAPAGDSEVSSWSATGHRDEMLTAFAGWDQRLVDLISRVDTPGRWALFDLDPLPSWVSPGGHVTLLGDAAHPMFPFYAQGAAQAIEDGAVLARTLSEGVRNPFQVYETTRKPRATKLQTISRERKHLNHLPDGQEQEERDRELASLNPLESSSWIYSYDALTVSLEGRT